jgi:hypothetical protein
VQSHDRASDRNKTLAALQQKVDALETARDRTAAAMRGDQARVTGLAGTAGGRIGWDQRADANCSVLSCGSELRASTCSRARQRRSDHDDACDHDRP